MANPFRALWGVRREEAPAAAAMSACFFGIIGIFWILKPLKKALFIERYDAAGLDLLDWHLRASQAELLAKILNTAAAFLAMWLLSALSRRLDRSRLVSALAAGLAACCLAFALWLHSSCGAVVWAFYVFGDVFNMLLVAAFFAFANDCVTPEAVKRLYGPVVLGGVLGGVLGSTVLASSIDALSPSAWLLIAAGCTAAVGATAHAAGRLAASRWGHPGATDAGPPPGGARGGAALEGARLVLGSRYLLSIAAIVGLYELVSTLADFQFTETVSHYLDGAAIRGHVSKVFMITNILSTAVQIFVTGFAMSRFGVGRALLVLPIAVLAASAGFLALPLLWVGSSLSIADNGLNYSINQSAREALYVPAARAEKYRAKAFIDVLVQRFAKMIAVCLGLGLSAALTGLGDVRWVSLVTILLAALWIAAALFAGRRFDEMSRARARARAE
jgi:ATP:ADP antiporter, AAA family